MKIFYLLLFIVLISTSAMSQAPLEQTESRFYKFFPNPASSLITFTFDKGYNSNYSLQVFNFIGKKVYEQKAVAARNIIDLGDFYRGVYIFQIRDANGKIIESGKFQVAK